MPAAAKSPFGKHLAFIGVSFFIAVAGMLAIGELSLRILKPKQSFREWYHNSYSYRLDADTDWRLSPRDYGDGTVINRFGFRGSAVPDFAKPPGSLRILVLGGSAAFDLQKKDDTTWSALLQKRLQAQLRRPVEVINAGTPGFSTWQSRRFLTSTLHRWQADLVIVYSLYNDSLAFRFDSRERIIEAWKLNARANHISNAALPHWFWDNAAKALPALTDYLRLLYVNAVRMRLMKQVSEVWSNRKLDSDVSDVGFNFYMQNLRDMADFLQSRGVPMLIATEASLLRPNNSAAERKLIRYAQRGLSHEVLLQAYMRAWKAAEELAKTHDNVEIIPSHRLIPAELDYFIDEVHLNDRGSALLADVLARELTRMRIFPQTSH